MEPVRSHRREKSKWAKFVIATGQEFHEGGGVERERNGARTGGPLLVPR